MTEWFYVKNDLSAREDIKGIIMRPIWQSFGLRRPKVEMNEAAEECLDISNVMYVHKGKATRIGFKMDGDKKVRFAKSTGEVID